MTDRRASFEGHLGRSRHYSPVSEGTPDLLESATTSSALSSAVPAPRRRPLRAKSTPNESLQFLSPPWVDTDKGEPRKAKGGRTTPRKASGFNSPQNSASPKSSVAELGPPEKERDTTGFLPKLSRILEGRETKAPKRRKNPPTNSRDDYTPARRRRQPVEDATLGRRPIRQKHGSLQRRAETLANLPNPSLLSVLSGLTQQSSASSGSNSTITQKSYDKNHISKRRPPKERKRLQTKRAPPRTRTMDSPSSSVFQYMNEGLTSEQFLNGNANEARPSSSASSSSISSRGSDHDEDVSSNAEDLPVDSPMTSPTSVRMSGTGQAASNGMRGSVHLESRHHDRFSSDSGISIRESSPESIHLTSGDHHARFEEHDEDEEEEEEEDSGDDNDRDEDEDAYSADEHDRDTHPTHHLALERAAPPRLPSASSSRHSDPHTRRLRNQEQELRDHVLQSPQPHRDFHFQGGPSPHPHFAMPLYDAYAHSGPSPVHFHAPAPQPPAWPPPAPPPPPMGYYSPTHAPPAPYSPEAENSYAMAARPPMPPPGSAVHHPPFYAHPQPPTYQSQPTGPDLTKTTVVGYELLADKLTEFSKHEAKAQPERKIVPMYRKFEQLNHRVLLHLQDEISELEEELRYLDECIAQSSPRAETGLMHPASRRGEARYGGELHYRRTDLLGRIYLKLGQYNQALSSFSTISKTLDAAAAEDIQAYRSWIERHAPIDASEARFLERKNDLLAVSQRRSASTVGGVVPHQSAAIGLPLIAILPLMAFAIVPSLLGRLFIITLIGGAEVMVVTSTELMDLMTIREWVICASIYFGLMAVLAGVVH